MYNNTSVANQSEEHKMHMYFESGGNFITAADDQGVQIRCAFGCTDCRDDEDLREFVKRHGGPEETARYLKQRHADASHT